MSDFDLTCQYTSELSNNMKLMELCELFELCEPEELGVPGGLRAGSSNWPS
jgi:hypothetical protein